MRRYFWLFTILITVAILGISMFDHAPTVESRNALTPVWQEPTVAGGGEFKMQPMDQISEEERAKIKTEIQENIQRLEREGRLAPAAPQAVPLGFPVIKMPGVVDFDVVGISNFVDHNAAFPNQVQDYNCGVRTYDLASGYNHKGVDIFTWPFGWNKMDNSEVQIVAAAPGTIVQKSDGNFDRNCAMGSGAWNAVYIRHADNSIAWYGHMKNGSTTSKAVGETVSAGEYLGIVGSSGSSTGPHLHFELYGSDGLLKDPYQGTCNTMNANSWWAVQEPYRVPKINKLLTGSAAPSFQTCPQPAVVNEKLVYKRGDDIVLTAFFRDQGIGHETQFAIVRPNGTPQVTWSHNSPNTYNASYWTWNWFISPTLGLGQYKFRATYQNQVYETEFEVVSSTPFDFDGDGKTDVSIFRPNGVTISEWWFMRSSDGSAGARAFGANSDVMAPGDFTGDGKTDIAFWRPSTGEWYILRSENDTFYAFPFGSAGDIPMLGDFDGDGEADATVFRPSANLWFTRRSSDGQVTTTPFGAAGDKPVAADYDGDGKTDIAVFRPNGAFGAEWWYQRSTDGANRAYAFGSATDKAVPADYTGNGRADIAFWRPSTGEWFILVSGGTTYYAFPFGIATDIPVPGDYDGDGKADAAVFRPSNSTWYLQRSTAGFQAVGFGSTGDMPVPNSYVR